jgi:predicted DNA-binding protein
MKQGTSFRLSLEALELLRQIAKETGLSQASVLEMLIREKARALNIQVSSLPKQNE